MAIRRAAFAIPLLVAVPYVYLTREIPVHMFGDPIGPRVFPYVITGLLCLAAVGWLVETTIARQAADGSGTAAQPGGDAKPWVACAVVAWFLAYISVITYLGFIVATPLFLLGLFVSCNPTMWRMNIVVVVVLPLAASLLFSRVLDIPLPKSSLLPL